MVLFLRVFSQRKQLHFDFVYFELMIFLRDERPVSSWWLVKRKPIHLLLIADFDTNVRNLKKLPKICRNLRDYFALWEHVQFRLVWGCYSGVSLGCELCYICVWGMYVAFLEWLNLWLINTGFRDARDDLLLTYLLRESVSSGYNWKWMLAICRCPLVTECLAKKVECKSGTEVVVFRWRTWKCYITSNFATIKSSSKAETFLAC